MGDEIEAFTEGAKAAQEIAKTTGKVLDVAQAGGVYLARMLGTAPEDVVGLLGGDLLRQYRIRNWHRVSQKTFDKLGRRGVEQLEPLSAKVIVPLLEAASEESDETLQDMWAELLANAMDPKKDTSLRQIFIEALRQMEPIDALVFRKMAEKAPNEALGSEDLMERLRCRETLAAVSLDRLADLGVLREMDGPGTPHYVVTALGTELYLASSPDASD